MSLFIGTEPVRTLPTPDGDQRQYYVWVRDAARRPTRLPPAGAGGDGGAGGGHPAAETGVQALPLTEAEIAAR